jgi:hypothetical protein
LYVDLLSRRKITFGSYNREYHSEDFLFILVMSKDYLRMIGCGGNSPGFSVARAEAQYEARNFAEPGLVSVHKVSQRVIDGTG